MDPIKICAKINGKVADDSVIKFKLDQDPPQRWIYFLTFIESMEMVFSQHKETCELILDYPKIAGEGRKYYVKRAIKNLLHENIYVHSRRLIAEVLGDEVKYISKLQLHFAHMNFSDKSKYDRLFQKVTHKGGK